MSLKRITAGRDDSTGYGFAQITLAENGEALVEGKIGILEYAGDCIRLHAGKKNIRFLGEKLYIRCLNCNSAVVMGKIGCIEFMPGR